MKITVQSTHLDVVVVLRPHLHRDERGWFVESYRADPASSPRTTIPGRLVA